MNKRKTVSKTSPKTSPKAKAPLEGSSQAAPVAVVAAKAKMNGAHTLPVALRSVCVYCGSGKGKNPAYAAAARLLGKSLAKSGIELVYGGGSLGLMGDVATSTLKHGGRVTGIIPAFLSNRERMLDAVNELIVTDDMHQRKMEMFKRSDAFIALPGGIGTLEELVEQLTWSQLGRHRKPIVLANIDGFWSPFLALLEHMGQQSFIRPGLEVTFIVVDRAQDILPAAIEAVRAIEQEQDSMIAERF